MPLCRRFVRRNGLTASAVVDRFPFMSSALAKRDDVVSLDEYRRTRGLFPDVPPKLIYPD